MTAATVEARTLADELALETPTARKVAAHLATIADAGVRHQHAAQAVADRRSELALAAQLLAERFGKGPRLADLLIADDLYNELLILAIA